MKNKLDIVDAKLIAKEIKKLSSQSANEEELKIKTEYILRKTILDKWDIPWARYEHKTRTVVTGLRKDALYGSVIIEYKSPGKLIEKQLFKKYKNKVKQYIAETAQEKQYYNRFFGVLLDGEYISFIRYRRGNWEESEKPSVINSHTILRMLQAIRSLTKKPLDVDLLLQDFGPKSIVSKNSILCLYKTLQKSKSVRTTMLFKDWQIVFSQISAYTKKKLKGLIKYYEIKEKKPDTEAILFAVHTYYTLVMKLLTSEIVTLFTDSIIGSYLKRLEDAHSQSELLKELKELEQEGGLFCTLGIKNFFEADYFAWYLDNWDEEIANVILEIVKKLMDYEPATVELNPEKVKDLFKKLYQNLIPRDVRHKLGEYFTPDWLAELVLNEVNYIGDPDKHIIDPACGSGTFLVSIIKRIRDYAEENFIKKEDILKKIVSNVIGIDLNPLAVLAAKANFLIALSDLLRYKSKTGIEIPVYLADSIFIGQKMAGQEPYEPQLKVIENKESLNEEQAYDAYISTIEGEFWMPMEVINNHQLPRVLDMINQCIKNIYSGDEFIERLKKGIPFRSSTYKSLQRLYTKIMKLENENKNRIWTRLLKNRFVPLLLDKFDFVVGNPPWINWENLPEYHRRETKGLWQYYGLLQKTPGMGIGKTKKDLAMLFVARCLHRYCRQDGILGFLIPFTLFKTQAGAGFRYFISKGFSHGHVETQIKTTKVYDVVELLPFEGAINRTAMILIEHGKNKFPIPCEMWTNPDRMKISMEHDLQDIREGTKQHKMIFRPIYNHDVRSPWMIITEEAVDPVRKLIGKCSYKGSASVFTNLTGVFWIDIIKNEAEKVLIENTEYPGIKKEVKKIKKYIEKQFIYPLIRGRDLQKWAVEQSGNIILPVNEGGETISDNDLKTVYPLAYEYFNEFFKELINRGAEPYKSKLKFYRKKPRNAAIKQSPPFYWLFNASPSLAKYKVAWKYISGKISGKCNFEVAIIAPDKYGRPQIPGEGTVMFVPLDKENEAFYLSGILNSSPVRLLINSYAMEIHASTYLIDPVNIDYFKSNNPTHCLIADLSKQAHKCARNSDHNQLKAVEIDIDQQVANIYNISKSELTEIRKCLTLFKKGKT